MLTLEGMNFGVVDQMGRALRGYASRDGRCRVKVDYPAAASARSIEAGCDGLDHHVQQLTALGEEFEILAHSQGAEAVGKWLRRRAGRPGAPSPALLRRIILLGNPERRLGGHMGWQFGGTRRTPTPEAEYTTLDIARRRDPFANADCWGTRQRSRARMTAARLTGIGSDHIYYDDVAIDDCDVRAVSGNTWYLVAP